MASECDGRELALIEKRQNKGVDLAGRGSGPSVVTRVNVATLFPGVPESVWPLAFSKPNGWQNGGKIAQKAAKLRL